MNIGLDARSIFSPRPRGTGRNLFDAYRLIPELRPQWRFTLYYQRPVSQCPLVRPSAAAQLVDQRRSPVNVGARRLKMPGARLDAWFQVRLPLAAWRDGIDLLHLPANAAPAWCPVPLVVTIHDLIPLEVPDELPLRDRQRFQRGVWRATRMAAHIITPSVATRDVLCATFHLPAERVTVIPWAPDGAILAGTGADGRPAPNSTGEQLRRHYRLEKPWLLNFSGHSRRKNAVGLLAGFARLPEATRAMCLLVLVGCDPPSFRQELEALAGRLNVAADCRLLSFVPHEDLPGLLRGAQALLMPSLAEGFGLPILDALACGVPVLTSQRSSMPEVAGAAAAYCDPDCPASIAEGIAQVLREDVRTRLIENGHQRVRAYTWRQTALAMVAVYEHCLARLGRVTGPCEVPLCR